MSPNYIKYFCVALVVLALSSGCARYKSMVYMQDRLAKTDSAMPSIGIAQTDNFVINPGDNLYINIFGNTAFSSEIFNKQVGNYTTYNEFSLYLQGYMVDDTGYVELPVIGKIKVSGLTISQTQMMLQKKANEYLRDVVVDVRMLSYNITFIGEVARPGTYPFFKREINLIEALSKAGDVSGFADLRSVTVYRKTGNKAESVTLDLTKSDFYSSPYFWLQPNDVVYVKPTRAKVTNVNATTLSLFISSLSLLVLVLTYTKY